MHLIVGLGNPGPEYRGTRHNLGWIAVERLAERLDAPAFRADRTFQAGVTRTAIGTHPVLLALPTTFMNLSGTAVQALRQFFRVPLERLLIVQDELDLPLGSLKFSFGSGPAGHNGIRSVQTQLGTQGIARLRLGVGRPTAPQPTETYVLERFRPDERPLVETLLGRAEEALRDWVSLGLDEARQRWNGQKG